VSNFIIPIIGWSMYMTGHIALKRTDRKSQMKTLKDCRELLQKNCSARVVALARGCRHRATPGGCRSILSHGANRLSSTEPCFGRHSTSGGVSLEFVACTKLAVINCTVFGLSLHARGVSLNWSHGPPNWLSSVEPCFAGLRNNVTFVKSGI
jgi:hypothetical protein